MPSNAGAHGDEAHTKQHTIYVNTNEMVVNTDTLSFADVVALAFGAVPPGDDTLFTVLFHHAHQKPLAEGKLVPGQRVTIKDRTSFDVTRIDRP
ncbi:MAG: multiubiquitin domain-containing protein [Gemmatimonadota bacterium]